MSVTSRFSWKWAIPAFVALLAAAFGSVFLGGALGVKSASSAARLPIPSVATVHLEERTYMVSFGVYDSSTPGLTVPDLEVSIEHADTGERVELRRPTKRYSSAAGNEKVVDQYEIDVDERAAYRVRVAADEDTDGFLLIGDRPVDALGRVFVAWMVITVVGASVAIAVAIRRAARRGRLTAT